MKKLPFLALSTFLMLSVIPSQLKAATNGEASKTEIISSETAVNNDQLNEIKPIDFPALSTSENKEVLKETSPIANEQGRHNGRYRNNRPSRDVDVTIQGDGSYRHNHGGAYIGGGGVLLLILILVLIL